MEKMSKRTVTLEIAGAPYRMSSDADETLLHELSDLINGRIAELGPKAGRSGTPAQLLAMVALGLADDLRISEQRLDHVQGTTRRAVQAAIERIDRRLSVDSGESSEATGA